MKFIKRRAEDGNSETLGTLPKKKALLIGIQYENDEEDDKGDANMLRGPHRDVNEMRKLLIDCYEYAPGDIVVLIDRDDPGQIQPTRANMLGEVQKLVEEARPGDHFFFHYVGHTVQIWRNREDEVDECLIPTDGVDDAITSDELQRHLVDSLPIGSNLAAVFDCPSGLNLEHFLCNRAYVPWISEGRRRSESPSQWNPRVRPLPATPGSQLNPRLSTYRIAKSRQTSIGGLIYPLEGLDITMSSSSSKPDSLKRHDHPVSMPPCTGWCPPTSPHKTNVICLAACNAGQISWKDQEGSSMTKVLTNALRIDPHPGLVDLLTHISHELHRMYLCLHSDRGAYKKQLKDMNRRRVMQGLPPHRITSALPDLHDFQDPQMSSHRPLDRDAKWNP